MSVESSKRFTALLADFAPVIWGSVKIRLGGTQIGCSAAGCSVPPSLWGTIVVHRMVYYRFVSSGHPVHISPR